MFFRMDINKKRQQTIELTSHKTPKKVTPLPPNYFTYLLTPIAPAFINYLSAQDTYRLMKVNSQFKKIYQNEQYWIRIYNAHFGELPFPVFPALQYELTFLLSTINNANNYSFNWIVNNKQRIKNINTLYASEPWTPYYQFSTATTPFDRNTYGIIALKNGDLRSSNQLATALFHECHEDKNLNELIVNEFLQALLNHNTDGKLNRAIALMYAVKFKIETRAQADLQQALQFYKKSINPLGTDITSFTKELCYLLHMLKLYDVDRFVKVLECVTTLKPKNNLAALSLCFDFRKAPELLTMQMTYLQELSSIYPDAAVYYADNLRKQVEDELLAGSKNSAEIRLDNYYVQERLYRAKENYIFAIEHNQFDAIYKLHLLASLKPSLLLLSLELSHYYLRIGVAAGNRDCIILLASRIQQQKNWHKQVYNIWLIQAAAGIPSPNQMTFIKSLEKHINDPDKNSYLHCALTLYYGQNQVDQKKCLERFQHCQRVDPLLFPRYLNLGRQFGLLEKVHSQLITDLVNQEKNIRENAEKRIKFMRN